MAGVSLDYYARLEQGRDLQPSDQVLNAVARALRLEPVEHVHLHNIVRSGLRSAGSRDLQLAPVGTGTRLMLDSLEIPAIVMDSRGDVQAMNRMGHALLVGLEPAPATSSNHPRWLFLEPSTRELMADWEMVARSTVGVLRHALGRYPHDSGLRTLIGELSIASPEFRGWWAEHDVNPRCHGPKRFRHPIVGDIDIHVETMQLADGHHWLYAYAVEPDTRSAEAMRLLSSWSATEEPVRSFPRETAG